ncbi:transglutaminase domain-containing protein [Flammeovirga sp. SubArs3]|uniref:transglutaminase domain-containing protein n=1 Tax=Flammeovirga sp. SubArs3 TaxID=2995316 RepID=UPI00248C75DB|nr:transglutaminase domain-containing protein [Flammeovirga sp. SubArs3]
MKKTTFLIIATVCLTFCTTGRILAQNNVKEYAKYSPNSASKSIERLANYLTKNESSDIQKAMNIYTWVVHNISLDIKVYNEKKIRILTPEQVLKRKKGTSLDYSALFSALCEEVNIPSRIIVGYVFTDNKSITTNLYKANHTWNAINIDSAWYLVDTMWGSGIVVKEKSGKNSKSSFHAPTFIKKVDYTFFKPSPHVLIESHLPSNPNWQLLEKEVDIKDFITNTFPEKNRTKNRSEVLDSYLEMNQAEYLYADAKSALSYNKKNFSTMGYASLLMAKDKNDSELKTRDRLQYLEEAKTSAYSYIRFIDLYSSIESEALKLWIRHYLETPIAKRQKFIDRHWINKDQIKQKKIQVQNHEQSLNTFKHKLEDKKYPALNKPRRQVEYDEFYVNVQEARLYGVDSALQVAIVSVDTLEKRRVDLIKKIDKSSRDLRNLSARQIRFLSRLDYLLQANVSLKILEHQANQVMQVEHNINVLTRQVKDLEEERYYNHKTLSKQISTIKRLYVDKQNILRGLYIKSQAQPQYKEMYDKVTIELKVIFNQQLHEKEEAYNKLKEHVFTLEKVNVNLTEQKEMIAHLNKVIDDYKSLKIGEVKREADETKLFCDFIIQESLQKGTALKGGRPQRAL